ncbi:MAG: precorrin-4 C(11)-methyltransferase [Spirochaetaceae bacterium]|jgi:precorrin-4/cobalt-precorrin-4 C11-methyltransferase|nr:precorrin-4 C(11)-methyltransferase [Spirochaetaceae bacterium]
MIYFVGAGPGAPDLITVRGKSLIQDCDQLIYAGSLVNPALLDFAKEGCRIFNSASMTLEEALARFVEGEKNSWLTVRLHTGDPSIYGAIREQMDALAGKSIPFKVVPGVSSFCAAAAALNAEYTLPGISQTLIISRAAGRTETPAGEDLAALASHGASMAIFLSAALIEDVRQKLLKSGLPPETPAAIVYKASWPDEKIVRGTIGALSAMQKELGEDKTALILAGGFLGDGYQRSKLYDPDFEHGCRRKTASGDGDTSNFT